MSTAGPSRPPDPASVAGGAGPGPRARAWLEAGRGPAWRAGLAGRRVAVLGLARSGLAACRLLVAVGARVTGIDHAPLDRLGPATGALAAEGVRVLAGGPFPEVLGEAELIVVSPGVPVDVPSLLAARRRGVPVIAELELAWRAMTADVVAITGTNGKTTTTTLVGDLLAETGRPVVVGGNIGRPLSADALGTPADALVVAEVSSFQLETVDRFRPRVAALLNLTPDHLDRHRTLRAYAEAKARVFARQEADDWAVVNADDPETVVLGRRAPGRVLWFSRTAPVGEGACVREGWVTVRLGGREEAVCPVGEVGLRGAHNLENVLAAVACAAALGVPGGRLRPRIRAFRAVAHRLEWVRERGGVAFYNDSKGTNVDATRKALAAFPEPVVLIAGGRDKGQSFGPLAEAAAGRVKAAVLIGEGRATMGPALRGVTAVHEAASMAEAVTLAASLAVPGDVVLLSPACASFDMFRDYEHRGEVFKQAVLALPGAPPSTGGAGPAPRPGPPPAGSGESPGAA